MDGRKGGLDPERGGAYSKGMNIEEKALSTFRTAPWRHNCAQAVCAALGREDLLETVSSCGAITHSLLPFLHNLVICLLYLLEPLLCLLLVRVVYICIRMVFTA